ncbi:PX domain family protein [Candida albicans]|uniref:PX domain family protein n=1 Tax=Candida albicans TaxID=5476 RepID=A0A8H6BW99_CANAX|nr:PX domain family protein [Candida albicans]
MSTDNLFEDIEQDNNPSFYASRNESKQSHTKSPKPPLQSIHSGTSNAHPQSQPQHKHKHNTSLNNGYPNELVNSTIGLSNRILELLNDSQLQVDIINSEKLVNSSVIVYTIELSSPTTKIVVKRRYSEFKSLRDNLLKLFPTLIIPPIPEKHSILSYLLNTINHSHEISIIEMRKRYFKMFLDDLIFQSDYKLKNCPLLHKFFDPNYELCWYNALNEPPVSLIPDNLLLANPINPADQNGLYSLLPIVNGFDFNSHIDNLSNLKKINEDLYKLNDQVKLYELKGFEQDLEFSIPEELIQFEIKFHQTIKILTDLNKLNSKTTKNYKSMVDTLIDLGGNLNNFSLQVYQQKSGSNNELSEAIEKFGSTMDQSFLNFESFILNQLVPQWQEPVDQLILYLQNSLGLIKFYKYKIVQFKILYKLKFNKFQQLINLTNIGGVSSSGSGGGGLLASRISTDNDSNNSNNSGNNNNDGDLDTENFDHLKELNSPTINNALKNLSTKKISKKSSWYGLFGGNNQTKKFNFQLPIEEPTTATGSTEQQSQQQSAPNSPQREQQQQQFKLNHIEKELNKLNQLIELCNQDMHKLTEALVNTFEEFLSKIERKWLQLMITYIQNCKNMFEANLTNWKEFKESLVNETREVN